MISVSLCRMESLERREQLVDAISELTFDDVKYIDNIDNADIWVEMGVAGAFQVYIRGVEFGFDETDRDIHLAAGLIAGVALVNSADYE